MPAGNQIGFSLEMHDSKEFRRSTGSRNDVKSRKRLQILTEYGESPTFFRSIASEKAMVSGERRGSEGFALPTFLRAVHRTAAIDRSTLKADRLENSKRSSLTLTRIV